MRSECRLDHDDVATVLSACLYLLGERQRHPCPGSRRALLAHLRWLARCEAAPRVLRVTCAHLLDRHEAETARLAELLAPEAGAPLGGMH